MHNTCAGCADHPHHARPYIDKTYKRKKYGSLCELRRAQGRCKRPYTGIVQVQKQYTSRCVYYKDKGYCNRRYYASQCTKTCTGTGEDRKHHKRTFKAILPVVLAKKAYASMCAYHKDKGRCSHPHYASRCKKTCGRCTKASNAGIFHHPLVYIPFTRLVMQRGVSPR